MASATGSGSTAGWKTFASTEYPGWSFSYPPSWTLTDNSYGTSESVSVSSPHGSVVIEWQPDPGNTRDVNCSGPHSDLTVGLVALPHAPGLAIAVASNSGHVYGESVVSLAPGSTTEYLTITGKGLSLPGAVAEGPINACGADFYFVNPKGVWGAGFGTISASDGWAGFGQTTATVAPTTTSDAATLQAILESLRAPGH